MSGISKFGTLFKGICALALVGLAALPVRADFLYPVSATQNLAQIANRIRTTVDSGVHVVQFKSQYTDVGTFRLDVPAATASKIDTLVFEREERPLIESDQAIRLVNDSALFEIKNLKKGTLVLRGLAFQFDSPDARLLAGSELGKENLHLIIDSCFIFGDNMNSSFLNWLGGAGSKVEIKRSFFVFRNGSPTTARINLSAGNYLIANNLFNFQGQVVAGVGALGTIQAQFNTINRTQFRLNSEVFESAYYQFARNFIGYKPSSDAFGGVDPYVLWATNFKSSLTFVSENIMYQGWKAFDHPANFQKFASESSNRIMDTVGGKPSSELWNWYQAGPDSTRGHQTGDYRRKEMYDVWPGQTSRQFFFEFNDATATFKPAPFPRQLNYGRFPMPLGIQPADLRVHSPNLGAIHFGPFQIENISVKILSQWGNSVLLSGNQAKFTPQKPGGQYGSNQYPFANDSLSARYFYIAFKGNTPVGPDVIPGPTSSIGPDDSLSFDQVDSAGYTTLKVPGTDAYPDSLRNLMRNMLINTSASVSDSVLFGARLGETKPYLPSKVYWWNPQNKALIPAGLSLSGKYFAKTLAAGATQPSGLSVFLVERLNVKRGATTPFKLAVDSGEVLATSAAGYQLAIDSSYVPNALYYGQATRGYKITYTGRLDGDPLVLKLKLGKDAEVFKVGKDSIPVTVAVPAADSAGFVSIPVAKGDSAFQFFTGIKFNVIAGQPFTGLLEGVRIMGLLSSTSGKLAVSGFEDNLLNQNAPGGDTLPKNFKGLGGFALRMSYLSMDTASFSAGMMVTKAIPAQVEAYAWDGLRWRKLPLPAYLGPTDSVNAVISGIRKTDRAVAVVERLRPAEEYVIMTPTIGPRSVTVMTDYSSALHRAIDSYALVVQRVNQLGQVDTVWENKFSIGQSAHADLSDHSGMFQFFVQYYSGLTPYNRPLPTPITSFNWLPKKLQVAVPIKAESRWHLMGFPYGTTFLKTFQQAPVPDSLYDRRAVFKLKTELGKTAWDSIPGEKALTMAPGDAFLMNATVPHTFVVDDSAAFVSAGTRTLSASGPAGAGWRFISAPYPMNFLPGNVISSAGPINPFLELTVAPAPAASGQAREYKWTAVTDRLKAFEGYAYQFRAGETLTFNPWTATSPVAVKAKQAASVETQVLKVKLLTQFMPRDMELRSGPDVQPLAFLAAPGNSPELRVGGEGGWFRKKVENLRGIDEAVEIRIPYAQPGRLALERIGSWAAGLDWEARLLNPVTGEVHDAAKGADMALPKGSSEYRLVAGDRAFVEERVGRFKAGIPAGLALSQNFPNPFRKTTSIALDWPSLAGPEALTRKAWIEVFDTRGKRVHRMDLGLIKAGRQLAVLDASSWQTGMFTYRLTVETGGRRVRLQKKMLVAP